MKYSLLVAMGDGEGEGEGEGEGVIVEKSSNLFGELSMWAEPPDSAGVLNESTPKLRREAWSCMY